MSLIVKDLFHTYNKGLPTEHEALHGISFQAEKGEIVSILGHTGSGKSTLAQHLNALISPQQGSVIADGVDAAVKPRDVRRMVGLVFQYPEEQIFAETVAEEIAFAPRNWRIASDKKDIDKIVRDAAASVGINESLLQMSPYNLSGGQKRSVAIASVIAARPSYLVLDEPTAGLDGVAALGLVNILKNFAAEGMGIIHITHDIELALIHSAKILVLEEGRALSFASPEETAEFLCTNNIKGLVVPELLELSRRLRDAGRIDKLCWDAVTLADSLYSTLPAQNRG